MSRESSLLMDDDVIKQRLFQRRKDILEFRAATDESRRPVELDQSRVGRLSRMDALQEQAMSLEIERRRKLEMQRIDAALQRIEEGEFGYCLLCGEEIGVKRLDLDPTLPTCVACAKH
jgi:DnaK suppressor protein